MSIIIFEYFAVGVENYLCDPFFYATVNSMNYICIFAFDRTAFQKENCKTLFAFSAFIVRVQSEINECTEYVGERDNMLSLLRITSDYVRIYILQVKSDVNGQSPIYLLYFHVLLLQDIDHSLSPLK